MENPKTVNPQAESPTTGPSQDMGRHPSRMVDRPGPLLTWLGRAFFGAVRFDEEAEDTIRNAAIGAIPVYVLNVFSLLDYIYFNFGGSSGRFLAFYTSTPPEIDLYRYALSDVIKI